MRSTGAAAHAAPVFHVTPRRPVNAGVRLQRTNNVHVIPGRKDPALRDSLLKHIYVLGGIAVAEDLRPRVEIELNLSINANEIDQWKPRVSWALIDMRDEGLLASPFEYRDCPASRSWIRKNCPGRDPTQQVWRVTQLGRSHLQSIGVSLSAISVLLPSIEADSQSAFDVADLADARTRIVSTIVARRGQPEFRRRLLSLYNSRCAFTRADASEALEAAHIIPYKGEHTNHPSNGLLLRADIHTLFDLGFLAVNSGDMTIIVSGQLQHSCYSQFSGNSLSLPESESDWPSTEALDWHRAKAEL